jgi:DNA-binding winged helix-turn-helix (wHTH) protein
MVYSNSGSFRLMPGRALCGGKKASVSLNFRAFDVLLYFVQNPGRVLTREELLKNVWPDTFVDEHNLAQSISVLRRALEEKPDRGPAALPRTPSFSPTS